MRVPARISLLCLCLLSACTSLSNQPEPIAGLASIRPTQAAGGASSQTPASLAEPQYLETPDEELPFLPFLNPSAEIRAQFLAGQAEDVVAYYATATVHEPDKLAYRFNLASAELLMGHPQQTLINLERVLILNPDFAPALFTQGLARLKLGDYHAVEALAHSNSPLKHSPRLFEIFKGLAAEYALDTGFQTEELQQLQAATPADPLLTYFRAKGLVEGQQPHSAKALLDGLIERQPDMARAYVLRARLHSISKESTQAHKDFEQALALNPGSLEAHRQYASFLMTQQSYRQAIKAYQQALTLRPDHLPTHLELAEAFLAAGQAQDWLDWLSKHIVRIASHPYSHRRIDQAYVLSARANAALGHLASAISDLNYAFEINPGLRDSLRLLRASLYEQMGGPGSALPDYDALLEKNPDAALFLTRGRIYFEYQQYAQALKDFDAALSLKPFDGTAHLNRAASLSHLGRFDEAIASYEQALQLDPDNDAIYLPLAQAYAHLSKCVQARALYAKANQPMGPCPAR